MGHLVSDYYSNYDSEEIDFQSLVKLFDDIRNNLVSVISGHEIL